MLSTDHNPNNGSYIDNLTTRVNLPQEGLTPADRKSLEGAIAAALTNEPISLTAPTESERVAIVAIEDGALLGYAHTPQEFIKLLAAHQTVPDYFCADCPDEQWNAWVEMAWAAIEQRGSSNSDSDRGVA